MKLHWSPRSPFVRKVMIVAHERGLVGRLNCVRTVAATTAPHKELMLDNPLSKIPTLVLDDGSPLYDSPVICDYLDNLDGKPVLHPADPAKRLQALRWQALADGFLDLLLLWRGESMRPEAQQSQLHHASFSLRSDATLDTLEREVAALDAAPFSIGHITVFCALSYLDFRFPRLDWRKDRPKIAAWHAAFAGRPSAKATEVIDDS